MNHDKLDQDLKRALARKPPSPGFSERVLQQIKATEENLPTYPQPRHRSRQTLGRAVILAAACALALVAVEFMQPAQPTAVVQHEGEVARAQLIRALGIASHKTNLVKKTILGVSTNQPAP